jgi:hypothetical protein
LLWLGGRRTSRTPSGLQSASSGDLGFELKEELRRILGPLIGLKGGMSRDD